ncbi:MAG: hypothetical protein ABI430_04110 [Candidatus Taylorbacteria bacterium]
MYKKRKKRTIRIGGIQRKIMLLLLGGLGLACTRNPNKQWKIIQEITAKWRGINREELDRAINRLYKARLIEGSWTGSGAMMILTVEGKKKALCFSIDDMKIHSQKVWDKTWRIVTSDIPDKYKNERETFRLHLQKIGFHRLQESVWVHPYPCEDELDYIIEFYDFRKFVRYIEALYIDNELDVKKYFGLL